MESGFATGRSNALQPDNHRMGARRLDQGTIDEALLGGDLAVAVAHVDVARSVRRSGAPGPAPTRQTLPTGEFAKQGQGIVHRGLVAEAEVPEACECGFGILVRCEAEGVEAAALERE